MEGFLSPLFSADQRIQNLDCLSSETFDALVIGGGITGAAVARDAALRGLKVALVEADDFASGTSSGSSKLIHGGLRYLEQFHFKLVFEAIREREKLKALYAPFVQDLRFVFPTYRNSFPPRWQLNVGLHLYDSFAAFRSPHENLSADETKTKFPWLKTKELSGSCIYIDSFAEDYRLVVELIKGAHRKGAVMASQLAVKSIHKASLFEVCLFDRLTSKEFTAKAKYVFNCSGPFSDQVRGLLKLPQALRLTQGVHFIISKSKLPIESAFVMSDPKLHRILFVVPWNSVVYIGTTDTDIEDPAEARADAKDLSYVLRILNAHFNVSVDRSDIIQSWAAVRPLLKPADSRNPSEVSREHILEENPKGCFHLLGGKLTSHRVMASEALDKITDIPADPDAPLQDELWKTEAPPLLQSRWGRFARDVEKIDRTVASGGSALAHAPQTLKAEVLYSIRYELALRPIDFIRRRSSLYYECPSVDLAQEISEIFQKELNWNKEKTAFHLNEVLKSYSWDKENF